MTTKAYRSEYPRPQFVRQDWMDLNGEWAFSFDDAKAGMTEQWYLNFPQGQQITVPFTYETKASGINVQEHHDQVWYQKTFTVPAEAAGKRTILQFEGVDYKAKCWVNGIYAGEHEGAYTRFSFDITPYLVFGGENRVVLGVEDSESCTQPRGKQRWMKDSFECFYVQSTGIWKSVWLEYVSEARIESVKMTPDFDQHKIRFDFQLVGVEAQEGYRIDAVISLKGTKVKQFSLSVDRAWESIEVDLLHKKNGPWLLTAWSPQHPDLYDVEFVLNHEAQELDRVDSYFGMRKISIENGQILLNNAPLYQRLILDQGYWEDTHLTPPSEAAIIEDIDLIMAMGYNGVRKHMKIEDARFLYWCDVKGLLVWSEMAATYEFNDEAVTRFTKEWLEVVPQQYNHPSIITWVPFNESWGIGQISHNVQQQKFTESIYHLTKAMDPYRPVVTNDGWEHTVSDILTLHDYVERGEEFAQRYRDKDAVVTGAFNNWKLAFAAGYSYKGQPIIISEFGGIAFKTETGWGYGNQVRSEEDFLERFRSITTAIKETPYISGYCYTQVTDVQQEVNGLLTEGRQPKVPLEAIRKINLG